MYDNDVIFEAVFVQFDLPKVKIHIFATINLSISPSLPDTSFNASTVFLY